MSQSDYINRKKSSQILRTDISRLSNVLSQKEYKMYSKYNLENTIKSKNLTPSSLLAAGKHRILNMEMEEVITEIPPIYTNNDSEPIYDEESESLLQDVNPNYYIGFYPRYTNFNLSFSFKFEYNPNSDIYVIYRLSRSINGKIFNNINDFLMYSGDDRWNERYFDASFYIKFNYWFNI